MKTRALVLLSALFASSGCGSNNGVQASQVKETEAAAFATVKAQVFDAACMPCHSAARARAGVNLTDLASAKENAAAIKTAVFVDKVMPPRGTLTEAQKTALTAWLATVTP